MTGTRVYAIQSSVDCLPSVNRPLERSASVRTEAHDQYSMKWLWRLESFRRVSFAIYA